MLLWLHKLSPTSRGSACLAVDVPRHRRNQVPHTHPCLMDLLLHHQAQETPLHIGDPEFGHSTLIPKAEHGLHRIWNRGFRSEHLYSLSFRVNSLRQGFKRLVDSDQECFAGNPSS